MSKRLVKDAIKGIEFFYRPGTSDLKTFKEVIGQDVYQKRGNKIQKGEHWVDCGGNVGAFALLALKSGANVTIFEPDPFNCEVLRANLELHGYNTECVNQLALVHDETKTAKLYAGTNGNYWRNSLLKNWSGKGVTVNCTKFDDVVPDGVNVKMDIEGLEMPIIELTRRKFNKLIFEWSFDIDPNLERYWRCLEKLEVDYELKCATFKGKGITVWPKSWFPACTNVFCFRKA